jgi:hypothetical protein
MNLRQSEARSFFAPLKTSEVALLLHGLRAIYVADEETTQQKLILQLETELASRGHKLAE